MDDREFDTFTRTFTAAASRRSLFRLLAGGAAGGLLGLFGRHEVTTAQDGITIGPIRLPIRICLGEISHQACRARSHVTEAHCSQGRCVIDQCDSGWADCDGTATNGCETQLGTAANCSSCGDVCPPNGACLGGMCAIQWPPCDGVRCGDLCCPPETVGCIEIPEISCICPRGLEYRDGQCLPIVCPPGTACSGDATCGQHTTVGLCCQYPNSGYCCCDSAPGANDGFALCCSGESDCPPCPTARGVGGLTDNCSTGVVDYCAEHPDCCAGDDAGVPGACCESPCRGTSVEANCEAVWEENAVGDETTVPEATPAEGDS